MKRSRQSCRDEGGDGTQKVGMNYMYVVSGWGSKFDCNSLSNCLSNMRQDRDIYTRMKGLEKNMKLILVVSNITRLKNTRTVKQNIEICVASNSAKNPPKKFSHWVWIWKHGEEIEEKPNNWGHYDHKEDDKQLNESVSRILNKLWEM